MIVFAESREEDGRCFANFVLLSLNCLLHLATERLEDGLEVRIDHEWHHGAEFIIIEFKLRVFPAGRRKHKKLQYEVISFAQLLVMRNSFFCTKMSDASEGDLMLMALFGEILK